MKGKCENCNKEHDYSYGSGRFCSKICARGFSTKAKRKEINKQVSDTQNLKNLTCKVFYFNCLNCNDLFTCDTKRKNKNQKFCSVKCSISFNKDERGSKISKSLKEKFKDINERNRLKEIGRKGGFGKKGVTTCGTQYQSSFEEKSFTYLEKFQIKFEPHKNIPNSSKVSDIYLNDLNCWIELDGINREKRKEWLGKDYQYWLDKLDIYKHQNLLLKIFYSFEDFKNFIDFQYMLK